MRQRQVYINGARIDEPYAHFLLPVGEADEGFDVRSRYGPVTVPDGHLFVMGDNRDNSQDSRYWGFLPIAYVKGRALMVYWSFDPPPGANPVTGFFSGTRWSRLFHQIR